MILEHFPEFYCHLRRLFEVDFFLNIMLSHPFGISSICDGLPNYKKSNISIRAAYAKTSSWSMPGCWPYPFTILDCLPQYIYKLHKSDLEDKYEVIVF